MAFDVEGARQAGYSDDEIRSFLSDEFDVEGALGVGYSLDDVGQAITPTAPERPPLLERAATVVKQAARFEPPGLPEAFRDIAPEIGVEIKEPTPFAGGVPGLPSGATGEFPLAPLPPEAPARALPAEAPRVPLAEKPTLEARRPGRRPIPDVPLAATVYGAAKSLPFVGTLLPEGEDIETLEETHPGSVMLGYFGGMAGQTLAVGGVLGALPKVRQLQTAISLVQNPTVRKAAHMGLQAGIRATAGGVTAGASQVQQVAQGKQTIGQALLNTAETSLANAVSVLPEGLLPRNALQLVAQPAADALFNYLWDKSSGRTYREEDVVQIGGVNVPKRYFWESLAALGFATMDIETGQIKPKPKAQQQNFTALADQLMGPVTFAEIEVAPIRPEQFVFTEKGAIVAESPSKLGLENIRRAAAGEEIVPTGGVGEAEVIARDVIKVPEYYEPGEEPIGPYLTPAEYRKIVGKLSPEDIPPDFPKRPRGAATIAGAIGAEPSARIKAEADLESQQALKVQDAMDKQSADVQVKFSLPLKTQIRRGLDKLGEKVWDRNYYARRLLRKSPDSQEVLAEMVALKGSSAEAKAQFDAMEHMISEYLPHRLEDNFNTYLQMERIVEVEKVKESRGAPELSPSEYMKHTGGVTRQDAQAWIDTFSKQHPEDFKAIQFAAKRFWKATDAQLVQYRDEGLITNEVYEQLRTEQPHYNPRRFLQHIDPTTESIDSFGKRITVSDSGLKPLKEGSEQAMVNNWRNALAEISTRGQSRIFKNRAAKALYNFVQTNPDNPLNARVVDPNADVPAGFTRINSMEGGAAQSILLPNDVARSWVSNDPAMNRSLSNAIRILSGSALVRPFATGVFAPEFALSNIPRDAAFFWLTTKEYSPVAPIALGQMFKDYGAVTKDAWTGSGRYRDYIREGGGMEFLNQQGSFLSKDPTRQMTATTESTKQIWRFANHLQEFSERLGRLALRERAIKNGKSPREATLIARQYLDFSQGGSWTKAIDNAVPYLNAATQATRGLMRSFKTDPATSSFKATQVMVMGATAAMTATLLRKKEWDRISDREKVSRWNLPLGINYPDPEGETRNVYFSIPKDQGQRVFSTLGEVMAERAMGAIDGEIAWRRLGMAIGDLSPVDFRGLLPPVLSGALGYMFNKDFWVNDDIWKGREVSPQNEFYVGDTPKALIDMAQGLSKIGVEMSPARAEAAIRRVIPTNPLATLMGAGYEQVTTGMDKKDKRKLDKHIWQKVTQTPGVRKYMRSTWPQRFDVVQIKKDMAKYDISTLTSRGRKKTLKQVSQEIKIAKRKEADVRQENDRRLLEISETLLGEFRAPTGEIPELIEKMPTPGTRAAEAARIKQRIPRTERKKARRKVEF